MYILGGREFRSQAAIAEAAQKLLWGTEPGTIFTGEDDAFLRDLILRHPKAADHIGCGIRHFELQINRIPGTKPSPGFHIIQIDGHDDSFSYRACLGKTRDDQSTRIAQACRDAVADLRHAFKLAYFGHADMRPCQVTGEDVAWNECEVDHAGDWPFQRIVDEWMRMLGNAYWRAPLEKRDPGGWHFTTAAAREHFIRFHDRYAVLRVVKHKKNPSGPYRSTFVAPPKP